MRVETAQYAVDGGLDEMLVIGFLDVVFPHDVDSIPKQFDLLIEIGSR